MTLIGIRLFLREEELADLQVSLFQKDLCIISEKGVVEGLAVVVHGKSDVVPVTLMLWSDYENPAFCPVLHLLAFIFLSGNM